MGEIENPFLKDGRITEHPRVQAPTDRGQAPTPSPPSPSNADLDRLHGDAPMSHRALEDFTGTGPRHPNVPSRAQRDRRRT